MESFLLVDGHALLHRAFFALPPFKTKSGFPTNAIYGFLTILNKAISDFNPNYLVVCFDTPKPTFRNKLYKKYQIQRPKTDLNLKIQIPSIKKILKSGKILYLEKDGFEADDLLGTIVKQVRDENIKKLILTGDKDLLQLVDSSTFVVSPHIGFNKSRLFDEEEVINKLKIKPCQIPDYKALAGDPSDNYPGAKGIGPKTASQLINNFNTIENLFKKINNIRNEKLKNILIDNKDAILMAKKLALIEKNINLHFQLNKARFIGFDQAMKKELLELEMNTLVSRIFKLNPSIMKEKVNKEKINEDQIKLF